MEGVESPRVEVAKELHNTHQQLQAAKEAGMSGPFVAIFYVSDTGRGGIGTLWVVDRPGYRIDPDAHWALHGKKGFWVEGSGETFAQRKAQTLAAAQAWANSRYGEVEWAKNRDGEYLPAHINKAFPLAKKRR